MISLLPCPFCGGDAEMDTRRAYRAMSPHASIGHGVAIYCTKCGADMMHCYEDHLGTDKEDLQADLVGLWNRRTPVSRYAEMVEALRLSKRTMELIFEEAPAPSLKKVILIAESALSLVKAQPQP